MHWIIALCAFSHVSMATWSDDPLDDNGFYSLSSQISNDESAFVDIPKLTWPGFAEPRAELKLISDNELSLERTDRFGF